jgi:hypothetical protein
MRDAINSPAWGILDDWRDGGEDRSVSVYRSPTGYLLTAHDTQSGASLIESSWSANAAGLESAARRLVAAIAKARLAIRHRDIEKLRAELAAAERAELEAASSVECAASNHERAPDAEVVA